MYKFTLMRRLGGLLNVRGKETRDIKQSITKNKTT